MIAKYLPITPGSSILERCVGKDYKFTFAFSIKGDYYYEPIDKNFPTNNPVKACDLKIIENGEIEV